MYQILTVYVCVHINVWWSYKIVVFDQLQVCPRGERANHQKVCERCTESPQLYDWLYLGFMAMLPLMLHWFFIEWYSGKKR